ncbi:MAG: hypothetical protein V2I54_13370 [Bacteroidales bacterium]|nr:hypothetical protein [Bacteroidales bacterium]
MAKYVMVIVLVFVVLEIKAQQSQDACLQEVVFETNVEGQGPEIEIQFFEGPEIYYPLLAIWIEDTKGNYIQTLYVAESIAKGVFNFGEVRDNRWVNGAKRRPAALPYWGHQRGIQAPDGWYIPTPEDPVPDAYTGATPTSGFILKTRADSMLPDQFTILLEINQSWDWNEYWTNSKFPGDEHYKTSAQPAVVYAVTIDLTKDKTLFEMKPVGHSHYSGKDGALYPNISTLSTALQIADRILVSIRR